MLRLAASSLALLLGSCVSVSNQPAVVVTSEPLGAQVTVDGTDTGLTTPCRLDIGWFLRGNHLVELHKPGYGKQQRIVAQYTAGRSSRWIDGAFDTSMPPLPFFWTPGDFVAPLQVQATCVPSNLHVVLHAESAPPLGYDALGKGGTSPFARQ